MKNILLGLLLTGFSLMAASGEALSVKCVACHGAVFEKSALGKSAVVNGQSASDIYSSLIGYKQGTRNTAGMGALMKGQVASMSNNDLWAVAEYITSLSEEAAPAAEANDWPYACEQPDIKRFADSRYFGVSENTHYPYIVADSKTIIIDKKNKMIKVWTIFLASQLGRDNIINAMGQYQDYSSYGYTKYLYIINYKNMTTQTVEDSHITCDGKAISGFLGDKAWDNIQPDSTIEGIAHSIMKKYNLK